jgi:4-hydroxybenzoate polyprenyltransferase
MLFNRLTDWTLDQRNPRTAVRHRLLPRSAVVLWLIGSSGAFVAASAAINRTTFLLSPLALVIVFFYSVTKRFTPASHFFLGLALATAPVGAWIAATGGLAIPPLLLGAGVVGWVAGFDLIYATQDFEFDRRERLHSLVVRLGIASCLRLAQLLHLMMFGTLLAFGLAASLGVIYFVGMALVAAALYYEHRSAARLDLAAINRAFFQSNAFVGVIFLASVWAGL